MKKLISILIPLLPYVVIGSIAYIDEIPDYTQKNSQYCAPVAASNGLIWLSKQKGSKQERLIKKLASRRYMDTSDKDGTGTTGVLNGLGKVAKELFGTYSELEYQGWRLHPPQYSKGISKPDINWIKDGVSQSSMVLLNVGWYTHDAKKDVYERVGGHWVTLVGFEGEMLVIHDPAPRAGKSFQNEEVQIKLIQEGNLEGKKSGLPTTANGRYILGAGMHLNSRADVAIIDGAVRLKL
ncbi:MAG TPA: hypothetical protein DCX06_13965 [Opitutae bacterium]|nr:hypothetical protein [Opitutae bacterium]